MNTKRQLFTMLMPAALVATSDSASAQIPAIPEPGIVLYGKILAADGQSTVPASEVQLRLNSAPAQTGQVVAGADGVHFYVIKIPFESRLGGVLDDTPLSDFTDADSTYQLSTAPGSNRVSFGGEEDRTISAVDSAESTSSFQFGSGEARGKVVRMDILTDFNLSGVPTFDAWIAGYPSIPANQRGRDDDADGDGHSNGFEWIAGLDPTDASKANPLATFILDITDSKVPVNAKELSFRPKLAGRSYRVMKSNDLGQTNAWTPLTAVPSDAPVPGAPGVFESKVTDTNATQRTATYRIEINLNQ